MGGVISKKKAAANTGLAVGQEQEKTRAEKARADKADQDLAAARAELKKLYTELKAAQLRLASLGEQLKEHRLTSSDYHFTLRQVTREKTTDVKVKRKRSINPTPQKSAKLLISRCV